MNFQEYRTKFGSQAVADELTAKLGKRIAKQRVQSYGPSKPIPKAWAEALDLDGAQPSAPPSEAAGTDGAPAASEPPRSQRPPRPPADAQVIFPAPAPSTSDVARKHIREIHVFAGAMVAQAVDGDGFQNGTGAGGGVAKLWTDKADPIAEAWIAWAEEGNKFAQSVVRMMSVGGAGTAVLMGYLTLLGGTAYIMGSLPDNEASRFAFGRYSSYRTVIPKPRPGAEPDTRVEPGAEGVYADAAGNGAAGAGAAGAVGDPAWPSAA